MKDTDVEKGKDDSDDEEEEEILDIEDEEERRRKEEEEAKKQKKRQETWELIHVFIAFIIIIGMAVGIVLQKVSSEFHPKVRNHREGPY